MKAVIPVLLAAVILVSGVIGVRGTLAYLSDTGETRENAFTVGNVDINIQEQFNPPASLTVGDNAYQKRVTFKNDGTVDAYVRVAVAFSSTDVADVSKLSYDNGTTWYSMAELKEHLPSDWAYAKTGALSGYYYYTKPLAPGESTSPLFTNVKTTFVAKTADTNTTINYTPRDYDVYVYAEGVQQRKLDGSGNHTSYADAWTEFLNLK